MKIAHHVDDATLMSYAAGSLPEALSAVVATHLTVCGHCRQELAHMECIGASVMSSLPPATLTNASIRPSVRLESPPSRLEARADCSHGAAGDIPQPLARLVGSNLSAIRWRRLGLGMWHLPLELSDDAEGDLRLIKVAPGQIMPEHGHGGSELTLVLAGSYTDTVGRFGPGDIADLDSEVEHSPVADRETGCICLIASEEKAKFKGVLARLVQPFTGM